MVQRAVAPFGSVKPKGHAQNLLQLLWAQRRFLIKSHYQNIFSDHHQHFLSHHCVPHR